MSSSRTGMPALAIWAAMPVPITPAPMTAALADRASDRLQHGGDALAAADALGGERVAPALALQQRRGLAGDARAGGAERMAERERAAVEVERRPGRSRGRARRRAPATAKASLSSTTSMSSISSPARASAFRVAATGPMPMISAAQPATAMLLMPRQHVEPVLRRRSPRCTPAPRRRRRSAARRCRPSPCRSRRTRASARRAPRAGVGADAAVLVDHLAVAP